jgi:protein-S-isoprenylcysteine O-methyltransferase Ste14
LCIGLIVGIYWARVLRLARKTRKTTGHSANFLPPEPLGRALRIVWVPVVVAWLIIPFVVALSHPDLVMLRGLWDLPVLRWMAVLVAAAALVGTLVCWKRMGRSWRMGIDPNEKTQLIVTGPYAYVRHPIYALQSLLLLTSFVAVPNIMMLSVMVIAMLLLQWEARREERHLLRTHGADYAEYLRRVGRFVPRSLARS